jgi:hypothetical protein
MVAICLMQCMPMSQTHAALEQNAGLWAAKPTAHVQGWMDWGGGEGVIVVAGQELTHSSHVTITYAHIWNAFLKLYLQVTPGIENSIHAWVGRCVLQPI